MQECDAQLNLGEDHLNLRNPLIAQQHFRRAVTLSMIVDQPDTTRRSRRGLGNALARVGEYEEAVDHFGIVMQLAMLDHDPTDFCEAHIALGAALRHIPDKDAVAMENLLEAYTAAHKHELTALEAEAAFELSQLHRLLKQEGDADHYNSIGVNHVQAHWDEYDRETKAKLSKYLLTPPPVSKEEQEQEAKDAALAMTDYGIGDAIL